MFDGLSDINSIITFFALTGAIIQAIFIFNFIYSLFKGPRATKNPWESTTLEWTTPVERIHGNWPGDLPVVTRWAYDYSKPGASADFIPQDVPLKEGEEEH
jgi:cytochrome c oxidase subunit 1